MENSVIMKQNVLHIIILLWLMAMEGLSILLISIDEKVIDLDEKVVLPCGEAMFCLSCLVAPVFVPIFGEMQNVVSLPVGCFCGYKFANNRRINRLL